MAAATLDSVILELEARVGEYNAQVANSANTTERAMQRINVAATDTEKTLGQNRVGMQQLSFQLNDMATMFAMGARPMQIFASQSGQVIQAIQQMTSSSSGFMAFLGGPWGMAITTAVTLLATLGGQYLATADDAAEATSKLDEALSRFRQGLAQASDLSQAMTQATRDRVTLLAEEGQLRERLATLDRARTIPGTAAQGVEAIDSQRRQAQDRVQAIQTEIRAIDNRMEAAMSESRLQNQIMRDTTQREEEREQASRRSTRASGARRVAITSEQRAEQQQTRETERYIATLEDEYAQLTLSAEAYRQRGVDAQMRAAQTDEERAAIERLAASIAALNALEEERRQANIVSDKNDEAADRYRDKMKEMADEQGRLAEEQITSLADFYQSLFSNQNGSIWESFKREGLAAVALVAARWTIAMATGQGSTNIGGLFNEVLGKGGLFSTLGGLFGGPRATGGPVAQGKAYLVGERGPELFMPQGNGTIIPNQSLTAPATANQGVATVRLVLSGDIDARIDQRSAGVAVQVVRASAGEIVDTAAKETVRRLGRRTL